MELDSAPSPASSAAYSAGYDPFGYDAPSFPEFTARLVAHTSVDTSAIHPVRPPAPMLASYPTRASVETVLGIKSALAGIKMETIGTAGMNWGQT